MNNANIELVADGQPSAVIVISQAAVQSLPTLDDEKANPEVPADKIAWAAHDLQVYLEKMSGAEVPIVGDDQPTPAGTTILVGRSSLTTAFDAEIPAGVTNLREEEGYAILTDDTTLVLAGNDQGPYHGTEYAVSFFLYSLGVRWYLPGEFGEVIPDHSTITVAPTREISRPDFKMRNWWTYWFAKDLLGIETRWKIHNGMNVEKIVSWPDDSSVRSVLPPEEEKDNPEFAEVFAQDAAGRPYPYMPNLSSEQSVQYAAEVIKASFREHPDPNCDGPTTWGRTSWGIGADDGLPRDFSPGTEERHMNFPSMMGRFNDPTGMSTTEEWMDWVQRVAAEVYKEFPDHIITTNGYANRDTPPIGLTPDPKIWIMFAAIFSDTYHAYDNPRSWMTLRQYSMLKDWASMYDNIYMYNYLYYNLAGCGAPPIPLARRHMHEMPMLKKLGLAGFADEGRTVAGEAGVFPTYVRARLMWDADQDAQALMTEFFDDWYGPAAVPAQAFWDAMESAIEDTVFGGNEDHMLSLVYTPELIARLEVHLLEAERLAKDDPWAAPRVRADRAMFDYLLAYKAMERAEFDADWPEAARQAEQMNEVLKPAMDISRFYWDIEAPENKKLIVGQAHGFYYWGTMPRRDYYRELTELTNGTTGELITVLPESAKFRTDYRDDGRFDGWYRHEFDDTDWETALTTLPFFAQGSYLDDQGFPYLGALWYRLEVDVPEVTAGRAVRLYCTVAETEAWVWVNGVYVGHRPYNEAYLRPNELDLEVTDALAPGGNNSVVLRLHTNYQPAQMAAGLASRLFLYTPSDDHPRSGATERVKSDQLMG
jgi:hypothetical protein